MAICPKMEGNKWVYNDGNKDKKYNNEDRARKRSEKVISLAFERENNNYFQFLQQDWKKKCAKKTHVVWPCDLKGVKRR